MNELTDSELLERFARGGSEEAFTALVDRHVNLVHSAALRGVARPDQAEEITQAVFIILAHKAASLGTTTVLSGWLYRTARLTAANFRRGEQRRTQREQEAFMQSTLQETAAAECAWSELSPLLDDAMTHLRQADHDALVLRYFENKSLQEVGQTLGVGERAAQKRVGRALERLRRLFQKRGVVATAAGIAGAISTCSVQAAPAGLAATISAAAVQGSAVAGSTLTLVKGTLSIMSWIKTKMAIAFGAGALVASAGAVAVVHIHHAQSMNQTRAVGYAVPDGEMHARSGSGTVGMGGGIGSYSAGESGVGNVVPDSAMTPAEAEMREAKLRAERAGGRANLGSGGIAEKQAAERRAAGGPATSARSE